MILYSESLYYKDVNILAARPSLVESRSLIDFPMNRIIAAPMTSLVGEDFIKAAIPAGISVGIPRFGTIDEQIHLLEVAIQTRRLFNTNSFIWYSVGMKDWMDRIKPIFPTLYKNRDVGVLLDVANGYSVPVKKCFLEIKKRYPSLSHWHLGNVHTGNAFAYLEDAGANFVRVGIANGVVCATRDKTGVNRGQITEIMECANATVGCSVVADGGIATPADAAKAFGAGADYVMLGGALAVARESEAAKLGAFFGGASARQKTASGAALRNIEGKEMSVVAERSLSEILADFQDGIRSAISYSGYRSLQDYIGNAVFEEVKSV